MTGTDELVEALEDAFYAFPRAYANAKGAELHEERDCWWCTSRINFPVYNGIFNLRFEGAVQERISELSRPFKKEGKAFMVAALPSCTPSNLAEQLAELSPLGEVTLNAMACSMDELNNPPEMATGIQIVPAKTDEHVEAYARLYPLLFNAPTDGWVDDLVEAELEIFHSGHDPFHRYLGLWNGEPVAAGMTAIDGRYAVLDTLLTLLEHRNKGIGHALLYRALMDERARGAEVALVWSGPGADKLYARAGFRYVDKARLFIFA